MKLRHLSLWLVLAAGSIATASAQITIGPGGIQIGPPQNQGHGPSSIYITAATYGSNCGAQRGNLTRELINTCGGRESCNYRVDARIIGDPRVGCAKDFHVSYVCREGAPERWISLPGEASGQAIFIDCRR